MTPLKKLLCIVLSVVTITASAPFASMFTILKSEPISAKADTIYETPETYTSKNYQWKYQILYTDNDGQDYIQVVYYQGIFSSVTVPAEIDGKIVIGVSETFVGESSRLKTVTLSEGIEFIDSRAFNNNANYLTINLPSTLKYIATEAFYNAKIEKINFSTGLKAMGRAFYSCSFSEQELTLPDSLESIGSDAFNGSTITAVHFGNKVRIASNTVYSKVNGTYSVTYDTENKYSLFTNTKGLKYITVDEENPYFKSLDNCLYSKDMKILYKFAGGDNETINTYNIDDNTETVFGYAFYGTVPIDTVVTGKNLKTVCPYSFFNAAVNNIEFCADGTLETIEGSAFKGAKLNCNLVIPASVITIDSYAFSESSITSLSFESQSKCSYIYSYAFYKCTSLKSADIPGSVTVLGGLNDKPQNSNYSAPANSSYIFADCSALERFTIADNSQLKYLGNNVFNNCTSLKVFSIGENSSLCGIGTKFSATLIETLDLSNCPQLSFICRNSFQNTKKLNSVNLDNTQIINIEPYTFDSCSALENVYLSEITESIDQYAFRNCTSLTAINLDNVAKVVSNAFEGCTNLNIDYSDKVEKEYNNFKYFKSKESVMISGYTGNDSDLIIPDTIDELPVTRIYDGVFKDKKFNSVTFPSQLVTIGKEAFYNCRINEVPIFPDTLTTVGESAFDCCNFIGELHLPKNLIKLEKYAFSRNSSTKIVVGENTQSVEDFAFYSCDKLKYLDFGDGVKTIEKNAITSCFGLTDINFGKNVSDFNEIFNTKNFDSIIEKVTVNKENESFADIDGVLYNKDITELIYYPCGKENENFILPETVKTIDDYAFAYTYADSVDLSNVESIGEYAFYYSENLKNISIPSTVTEIGDYCFSDSQALETVIIGSVNIDRYTDALFINCNNLTKVIFDSDAYIKGMLRTFCKTSIESIVLPDNIETMRQTFSNVTSLKEITLPKNLSHLGENTLYNTSIEKIVMPEATLTISSQAFAECSNLSYVNLSNVTTIEKQAFENCISLESIDLSGVLSLNKYAFIGCDNLKKYYYAEEEKEAYIAENEFEGNETIETVVIGNSVNEIQDRAFADCTNLQTALIADEVENISDTAFENCDNLTIVCLYNSPVMHYAQKNNIPYETFVISPIPDQEYTGKAITPKLDVKQAGKAMTLDKDYLASYKNNINIGTANVTVVGLGDYRIFATTSNFKIVKTKAEEDTTKPTTKPTKPTTEHTKPTTKPSAKPTTTTSPAPTAKPATTAQSDTAKKAVAKAPSGAKKVNGEWVNSKQKKTSVKKLKRSKKSFKVTLKKASGVTGYQIQYSTSKKFTKETTKAVTVKGSKNTSKTIKKLKSKKKYFVKVRTYKNVKFNGKTVKVYSSWSKVKSVKTK